MSDKFLPDVSVGDFAMDILKSMKKDPNALKPSLKESTLETANAPDVSRINVPEDFIKSVTEGKVYKQKKVQPVRETSEKRLSNLIGELSHLISEARSILEECGTTMAGNIGTGSSLRTRLKDKIKRKKR